MDRVLVVFPTAWDAYNLTRSDRPLADDVELVFAAPTDADCPDDLDILRFVDETVEAQRGRIQGVFSSSDYPGATVAAAIATALGLPGSHPDTVMRTSHKYESRLAQRAAAPEAVPPFALVDPRLADGGAPSIGYPCFVKPVKGAFSVLARKLNGPGDLEAYLAHPSVRPFLEHTMRIFNALVARYGRFEHDGGWFIAEGLLRGDLVTLEGYATRAGVETLGIVDSAVDAATGSFLRFDYPSRLPDDVQRRMHDIARRVIGELGLVDSLFNIELIHDAATGAVGVIEVNPRMCGQFSDLYRKVDGVHGHRIALELALGRTPTHRRREGTCAVAASVPLRAFEPVRIVRAPDAAEIAAVEAEFPGTCVWTECATGSAFDDLCGDEDGASVRYAVINTGAADRAALDARIDAIRARLDYRLEPL
jgi:hypothetical protein